jgi:hypothetical protein
MALTASQILDLIAPQYSTDTDKASFLQLALSRTNACVFGANYSMAVAFRAAHMMTKRDQAQATGGSGGQIASKREGDLAVSYHKTQSSSGGSGDLESTSYGMDLLGLINGTIPEIGVTGGNDDGCEGNI